MTNIKTLRKNNAAYLAQLIIDQKFYKVRLADYDEPRLREKIIELRNEFENEKTKIKEKQERAKEYKDEKPISEDLVVCTRINEDIKKVEVEINEFEEVKMARDKGNKAISNVNRMLSIIDYLSTDERKNLNNL